MGWSHIIIEGICAGSWNKDGECPCGQSYPTDFCLLNGMCPHLGYTSSNEREASWFVPLRLILWDRLKSMTENVWSKLTWYIWDRWFFKKKWAKFRDNIKVAKSPTAFDKAQQKADTEFSKWLPKALKQKAKYENSTI